MSKKKDIQLTKKITICICSVFLFFYFFFLLILPSRPPDCLLLVPFLCDIGVYFNNRYLM